MAYEVSFREVTIASLAYNGLKAWYRRNQNTVPAETMAYIKRERTIITVPDERVLSALKGVINGIKVHHQRKDPKKYTVEEIVDS